jgi:hypothetical protein
LLALALRDGSVEATSKMMEKIWVSRAGAALDESTPLAASLHEEAVSMGQDGGNLGKAESTEQVSRAGAEQSRGRAAEPGRAEQSRVELSRVE